MAEPAVEGIKIEERGDLVVIEVPGERWEGTASDAERLLTHLHYVLARARPGTNIVSMFVNGRLWGGKTIESNPERALDDVRLMIEQLSAHLAELGVQSPPIDRD